MSVRELMPFLIPLIIAEIVLLGFTILLGKEDN